MTGGRIGRTDTSDQVRRESAALGADPEDRKLMLPINREMDAYRPDGDPLTGLHGQTEVDREHDG